MKFFARFVFITLLAVTGVVAIVMGISFWLKEELEKCFKYCELTGGFEEEEKNIIPEIVEL